MGTTGVYGDCRGQWVAETRPLHPQTDRARRRVHAEALVRRWARHTGSCATILRVPGIYALDRQGGDPRDRVRRGTPSLIPQQDGYTNHIHADDLARIAFYALWRGGSGRVMHAVDASDMRMGDWFDAVADTFGLSRPPRLSREEVRAQVSPMLWSFMSESRRLSDQRLHRELRCGLVWPTVTAFLKSLKTSRAETERQNDPR